ncbi:MAG: hypothetical protein V1897_17565, partial [Pseudomonadota bacterium]
MGTRVSIFTKFLIFLIICVFITGSVLANNQQSAEETGSETKIQASNADLEKALFDYTPVPEWLESVLNRLPVEESPLISAKIESEDFNQEIEQSFTSPTKNTPKQTQNSIAELENIPLLYTSP